MARPYDICIRGAGIVGSALALQLASKRLRVALTAPPHNALQGHSDVRAYALNQPSKDLLEAVRCWPDTTHATPVLGMQVMGDDGGQVQFSAAEQGVEALNWIVDVPQLEALLAQAVKFQPLIEVLDTPQAAALTVVCEGRHSATRTEFGVEFDTLPYGQWALATRVQCTQSHQQTARQWFSGGEITALLPLDGAAGHMCALVWSVSPERATRLQQLDATTFCQELEGASRSTLGALTLTGERNVWPLQLAQAQRWCGTANILGVPSAWVLAGDAAHNVHPLAGQGLNLSLGDVTELVRVLDSRAYWRSVSDMRLLRSYERTRKADVQLVGRAGDALQRLFNHSHPTLQTLRNWGMNGFERSGMFKQWIAQRAMGTTAFTPTSFGTHTP